MKPLLAALAGFALIGAVGATQVNAQGVRVNIKKGDKRIEVNTSDRSTRTNTRENFRKPVETPKKSGGHFIVVEKKVWVAGHYVTEHKDVWVPGRYEIVRERRVDRHGCVFYVSVKKYIPGHYECREVKRYVPGCYKIVQEKVWVEDDCHTCSDHHDHGHGKAKGHVDNGKGKGKGKKHNRKRGRR